jgi:hypothetical protein
VTAVIDGGSRHGGGADSELARQLRGGVLADGEAQHDGAGMSEQSADRLAARTLFFTLLPCAVQV